MKKMKWLLIVCCFMLGPISIQANDAVAVKEDGIYYVNLDSISAIKKLNSGVFQKPIIAPNLPFVAYLDASQNLYVSSWKIGTNITKIDQNIVSYAWNNDGNLMYAKENGGLYKYNTYDEEANLLIEAGQYQNLVLNKDGMLYAQKYIKKHPQDTEFDVPVGIVALELATFNEKIVVPYEKIPETGESLGLYPVIEKLADDGSKLYIWCKPNSSSMAADGVNLGYYDMQNNEFVRLQDITMLTYPDQITMSKTSSEEVVIINGGGRIMNENKKLEHLNVKNQVLTLLSENLVVMTPTYSQDGNHILFSGGEELKNVYKPFTMGQNHIFEVNLKSKEMKQLTFGEHVFDFAPHDLGDGEFVFVRRDASKQLSLMKKDRNGIEHVVVSNLIYNQLNEYYGHYAIYNELAIRVD
ncbi:MAG: hypothetical protein ACRCST_06325 [Turicibacter sp.]